MTQEEYDALKLSTVVCKLLMNMSPGKINCNFVGTKVMQFNM